MKELIKQAVFRPWLRVRKELDLHAARRVESGTVRSVCLMLGPYGNLTTLIGALLFLHPNCQVLNHAGERIFGDPRLDFIGEYSEQRFEAFLRYALYIAQGGQAGAYGGSIAHSHAFRDKCGVLDDLRRSGICAARPAANALLWKESLRTSNHLRASRFDWDKAFASNQRLRFLLPVRNPLDCAVSNIKTGHVKIFAGAKPAPTVEDALEYILDEILWFADLRRRYPARFHCFFEHGLGREALAALAGFLGLEPSEGWLASALESFGVRPGYQHPGALVDRFRSLVAERFAPHSGFAKQLLRFVEPA
jgi:hypothetical protein